MLPALARHMISSAPPRATRWRQGTRRQTCFPLLPICRSSRQIPFDSPASRLDHVSPSRTALPLPRSLAIALRDEIRQKTTSCQPAEHVSAGLELMTILIEIAFLGRLSFFLLPRDRPKISYLVWEPRMCPLTEHFRKSCSTIICTACNNAQRPVRIKTFHHYPHGANLASVEPGFSSVQLEDSHP